MKADTGASGHFISHKDINKKGLINVRKTIAPKTVLLPNSETISSTYEAQLNLPNINLKAKEATIFPKLTSSSLLSVGKLCDDDCKAIFTKEKMEVIKNKKIVLEGIRNKQDGLWDVEIPQSTKTTSTSVPIIPTDLKVNAIVNKNQSKTKLANYYHQCCFSPCIRTLTEAVKKGNFDSWPGFKDLKLYTNLQRTLATSKGHLDQERQGLQSTKTKALNHLLLQNLTDDVRKDFFPTNTLSVQAPTNDYIAQIIPFRQASKAYMDLTGRFPHRSSRGNEYILVVYDYDSNAILVEALSSRTAGEIKRGWECIHQRLNNRGVAPNLYILDNECSADLKHSMTKYDVDWQLATPHLHRANAAERAIRTFKNHFIAGLATTHQDFPISEWDRLLAQAEITLNLLRNARVNPNLSAYAYLFGPYDFSATPMAPPGTLLAAHLKPSNRPSWSPHAQKAWYIGPSLEHYRNFRCYIPNTKSVIVTDTVDLIANESPIPTVSHEEYLQQALMDILAVLQQKQPSNIPSLQYGEKINDAIITVASILGKTLPKPTILNQKIAIPIDPPEDHQVNIITKIARVPSDHPELIVQPPRVHHHNIQCTKFKALSTSILTATEIFKLNAYHIYDNNGKRETLSSLLKKDPLIWDKALSNEWGRLAQGNKYGVVPTNTIEFILLKDVPAGRDITYTSFICDKRPLKPEPFRVRVVVGGDRLTYGEDAGSPATDLLETKLLINSTISDADKGAKFLSSDLKDYFLGSPMQQPEYMKVHISKFSTDIIEQYNLQQKMDDKGYVYIKINKDMYGLKQAAILAYQRLVTVLKPYGYFPEPHSVGIWSHKTRKTKFCLCVDDFGVKYFGRDDANHFLNALRDHYAITVDWTGSHYCGLTMHWNYDDNYVDVSMPGYVRKQLDRYQHPKPSTAQYAPHCWSVPSYGKIPDKVVIDKSTPLDKINTKLVQSISGAFLYYGRAVDPTILPALTDIASSQSSPTEHTLNACKMLMDYLWTYPDAVIRFNKSDMILYVDSDAAYLVLPKARSRAGGHFYLGQQPPSLPHKPITTFSNGPVLTICKGLRHVVSSAAEAETGAAFHNSKETIIVRRLLHILGHPQHLDGTPFKMDNAVTNGFIHSNIRQRQSKSWNMKYHWMRNKSTIKDIRYFWDRGENNQADYFTKHHPPNHHLKMRRKYILKGHHVKEKIFHAVNSFFPNRHHPDTCQGCVAVPPSYSQKVTRVSRMASSKNDVAVMPLRHT